VAVAVAFRQKAGVEDCGTGAFAGGTDELAAKIG